MFDLIKAKKHIVQGKAASALFPMIVGLKPDLYLRGMEAMAEGERINAPDSDILPRVVQLERAVERFRLANIAVMAAKRLDDEADPTTLNANWRERFVTHASKIADEDMHEAWSRILAGEVNRPGSFSIRAIATVADMQRRDAESFARLCQFIWRDEWDTNPPLLVIVEFGVPMTPLVRGIGFNELNDLESFGLVARGHYQIGGRVGGGRMVLSHPGDSQCTATLRTAEHAPSVPMGEASLTTIGEQLSRIVDVSKPPRGYIDACFRFWKERSAHYGYQVERVTRGQSPND